MSQPKHLDIMEQLLVAQGELQAVMQDPELKSTGVSHGSMTAQRVNLRSSNDISIKLCLVANKYLSLTMDMKSSIYSTTSM